MAGSLADSRGFTSLRSFCGLACLLFLGLSCGSKDTEPEPQSEEPASTPKGSEATPSSPPPGSIRVYYDDLRSPHIFADTDSDVFYGLGLTQMRDFPIATLSTLWSSTGRFAEVAGPRVLKRDLRVRVWGVDEVARRQANDESYLDRGIRRLLEAYIDGVNAGRRFWLERPEMIERVIGPNREVWIDPVPAWMNPTFTRSDPKKLFVHLLEAEIELFHVLCLGVALNSGIEFFGGGYVLGTNVWLARNPAHDASVLGLMDAHQPIKRDGLRSYPVQLHGPRFQMTGIGMPGYPCIFSGFSDELFFGLSTPPKLPGPVLYAGLPFRLNERVPQTTMRWSASLEEGEPLRIRVDDKQDYPLQEIAVDMRYYDWDQNKLVPDPEGTRYFYRVPGLPGELEDTGVGYPVTQPAPGVRLDPESFPKIVFEGRSFLSSRNSMETFLKVGYSKRTGSGFGGIDRALGGDARFSFGRAEILLAGDVEGGMEYRLLTHAPRPGAKAQESRSWIGDPLLNGNDSGYRWKNFLEFDDLVSLSYPPGYDERNEVWLNCNTSPHYIRHPDTVPEFKYGGPPWLYDDEPWKTLRHDRARALFDRLGRDHVQGCRGARDGNVEHAGMGALDRDRVDRAVGRLLATLAGGCRPSRAVATGGRIGSLELLLGHDDGLLEPGSERAFSASS